MKFNLNDTVTVRLTERGRAAVIESGCGSAKGTPAAGEPYRVQMWVLMSALGPVIGMGADTLIERNEVTLMPDPYDALIAAALAAKEGEE